MGLIKVHTFDEARPLGVLYVCLSRIDATQNSRIKTNNSVIAELYGVTALYISAIGVETLSE